MAEYIEREAALKILTEYDRAHIKLKGKPISGIVCIAVEIEDIPAADVRPVVRGKWETPNAATTLCTCSVCGKVAPYDVEADTIMYWPALNFCPNCGAVMEES